MTVPSVLAAIRAGQVEVVSRPLTFRECVKIAMQLIVGSGRERGKGYLDFRWASSPAPKIEMASPRREATGVVGQ